MADPKAQVKKVKAYPIAATLKSAGGAFPAQVVKLTPQGFLAEITASNLQPGEHFEVTFELPVVHQVVTELCVMVKLYNQWAGSAATQAQAAAAGAPIQPGILRLCEMHFQNFSDQGKGHVLSFLRALNKAGGHSS